MLSTALPKHHANGDTSMVTEIVNLCPIVFYLSPNTDWYNISLIGSSLPWQPKFFNFTSFSSVNATKKLIFGYFDLPRVCAMVVK